VCGRWEYRDGYEVQWCGREGGGIEVLWHARMLCGCEAGCEASVEHGAGSGDHEDKQSRRCRPPILGITAVTIVQRENPPAMVVAWGRGHGGCWARG